jgi:hypothetical protein
LLAATETQRFNPAEKKLQIDREFCTDKGYGLMAGQPIAP